MTDTSTERLDPGRQAGRLRRPDGDPTRRRLLIAGGAIGAAAAVAACGGSSGQGASTSAAATSADPAPTTSAPTSAPTTATPTSAAPTSAAPAGDVLAPVSDIPVGGGQVFDGPKVVVTQPESGVIKGFTAVCPHQGCLVSSVENNEILCPCHGSLFSAQDGAVIQGPATQGLAPQPVSVVGEDVVLG